MNTFRNGDKVYTVADIERLERELAKANKRIEEWEEWQYAIAYRAFVTGFETEKPKVPNDELLSASSINHFQHEIDRYCMASAHSVLKQLRKEQEK